MNAPEAHYLQDTGSFPNSRQPVLVYRQALGAPGSSSAARDLAAEFERLFAAHGWPPAWRNGLYTTHHYHSSAHEVLGVYAGSVRAQLGGEDGVVLELQRGDAIVIPAGVAHFNAGQSPDFRAVGAYESGAEYDMRYGRADERPAADRRIRAVAFPGADPVLGPAGPLLELWSR